MVFQKKKRESEWTETVYGRRRRRRRKSWEKQERSKRVEEMGEMREIGEIEESWRELGETRRWGDRKEVDESKR
ncbi:MAG: hypothetical protein IH933_00225 [Euryarchaeota archaeon]|nr:hypothetical protein [Euryarchaeota archaeon]